MFVNNRYLTRGIDEQVPIELQIMLWSMVDNMPVEEKDYLQVFELSSREKNGVKIQHIHHFQEQPEYSETAELIFPVPITDKIYIIDDGDHSTMLFASEY